MKRSILHIVLFAFFCFFLAVPVVGDDHSVRLGRRLAEQRSAGQEMRIIRQSLQAYSGPDDERSLGDIAGFEVTVKYGTVRVKRKLWDWGMEFTTLLPNLHPGGPGDRRGIDLF